MVKLPYDSSRVKMGRLCLTCFFMIFLLIAAFKFLAGDQLYYRDSCGNIEMQAPNAATAELCSGTVVEQSFSAPIQRLDSISVQFGSYARTNSGKITIELWNDQTGELVLSSVYDASTIVEGDSLTLKFDKPTEAFYNIPLRIKIYADSAPGLGVTPLMTNLENRSDGELLINGEVYFGTLAFTADGTDYIWLGVHFTEFSVAFLIIAAVFLLISFILHLKGIKNPLGCAAIVLKKYRFLIKQLVSRDFKTKYKRSVLGVLWSLLNPILMMAVQYYVFSTIFKADIPHYLAYLMIGIVSFNFFSESTNMCLSSVLGNSGLISKVNTPVIIYPVTRVVSSLINLGFSLIPMIAVVIIDGVALGKSAVLAVWFMLCLIIFSLGIGLLLATSMVFFRDTQFLWGVLNSIWIYATPIFYPETILPDNLRFVLDINPIYYFLKNIRFCIIEGISPEPITYVQCMTIALAALIIGAVVFNLFRNKFILYL